MSDNGFKWRPNDNSSKTNLRYTLEAEKWVNAVSSAQRKAQPRSISRDFAFIGMLLELVFSVVLLLLLGLLQLLTAVVRFVESNVKKGSGSDNSESSDVSLKNEASKGADAEWNFKKEKQYPTGLQLIFYTSYGTLRSFWKFLYLFVAIFSFIVVVFFLLRLWFPDQFSISKEMFIFIGAVSLWNAFMGIE